MKLQICSILIVLCASPSLAQQITLLGPEDYQLKIITSAHEERAMFAFPKKELAHLIAGFSRKADEQGDILLLKINEDLEVDWQKNLGRPGFDFAFSGIETTEGNILLTGFAINPVAQHLEGYLVKCNKEGELLWSNLLSAESDNRLIRTIEVSDSTYFSIGQISTEDRNLDGLLVSIDGQGNQLDQFILGDELLNRTYNILPHSSGDFVISGITNANYPEDADIYIARVSRSGKTVWQKHLKNPQGDIAHAMIELQDQSYLTIGYSAERSYPLSDPYFIQFNDEGQVLAEYTIQTGKEIRLMDGYQTTEGKVISTGYVRDDESDDWDVIVVELDLVGQQFNMQRIAVGAGDDYAYHIVVSGDQQSLLVGYTSSTESKKSNILLIGLRHDRS